MAREGSGIGGPGWLLWVALAAVWFATLQLRPLLDPDEGRYAEIPREMLASGDWVTPRLDGLKYFEKPPLQYWATAATYSVFGMSEWTARLWTVALAFFCLPMVYGWATRLYGRGAGLAALGALAASPVFAIVGHLNLLDAGFTFWLTGTVLAFTLAQVAEPGSFQERRWMLLCWLLAALAVLSKGIVVGVLAGLALILYSLLERDWRPWQRLHVLLGVPLFLLVAVPWFALVSVRNPEFPGFFFIHEHFARFLTTVHQRVEPWWFFLPVVLVGVLPWLNAVPGALRAAWSDSGIPPAAARFRPLTFLLVFAVVTLVFFSASGSKLVPYVLPMFPVLAALVGAHVAQRTHSMREVGLAVMAMLVLVAAGLIGYLLWRRGLSVPTVNIWAAVAVACGVGSGIVAWRGDVSRAPAVVAISAASILGWQCLLAAYAAAPPARSSKELVQAVSAQVGPHTELYSVGQYRHTISPYLRRTLVLVGYAGELEFGLRQEPGRQWATRDEFLARWAASPDAVAFFTPSVYEQYRAKGLPGRVIARDDESIVVSRHEARNGP
jgi:4-amino-4-deoxy-L-arabinose transferase-like glycosyltransferase